MCGKVRHCSWGEVWFARVGPPVESVKVPPARPGTSQSMWSLSCRFFSDFGPFLHGFGVFSRNSGLFSAWKIPQSQRKHDSSAHIVGGTHSERVEPDRAPLRIHAKAPSRVQMEPQWTLGLPGLHLGCPHQRGTTTSMGSVATRRTSRRSAPTMPTVATAHSQRHQPCQKCDTSTYPHAAEADFVAAAAQGALAAGSGIVELAGPKARVVVHQARVPALPPSTGRL